MSNPVLAKNFVAGAAVAAYRFLKFDSTDGTVIQAAAATDAIIGASTDIAAASGERCDAVTVGIAKVESGGTITRGALVTADSNGKAVAAAPSAGANARIAGVAMVSASSGDIFNVLLAPSSMQGA